MKQSSILPTLVKLAVAIAICAGLFMVVISAMTSPVKVSTNTITAQFNDISGLRANGDVRTKGVRIGKVTKMSTVRHGGHTLAQVEFTVDRSYVITDQTVLSVKYQNLTGARYIDVTAPGSGRSISDVPLRQTRSSFDITELFNGLQPVLVTMKTDDINKFGENALTLLQGDGAGLASMMDDIQRLADLATDRERVISTLVRNLSRISRSMGGRSDNVMELLRSAAIPVAKGMTVLDEFRKTNIYGPAFLGSIDTLLENLGFVPGINIDNLLKSKFSSLGQAAEAFRMIPVTMAGLQLPKGGLGSTATPKCTNGIARLPADVTMLLNGSQVVVCKPR